MHVYSDAAGSSGCGALQVQKGWFALPWPHDWRALSIAEMELIPVVMAAALWGRCWAGQLVVFHSDNMGVVASVNKGISPEASLMQLLRSLSFIAALITELCTWLGSLMVQLMPCLKVILTYFWWTHRFWWTHLVPDCLIRLLITSRPVWGSQEWIREFRSCFMLGSHQQQHVDRTGTDT